MGTIVEKIDAEISVIGARICDVACARWRMSDGMGVGVGRGVAWHGAVVDEMAVEAAIGGAAVETDLLTAIEVLKGAARQMEEGVSDRDREAIAGTEGGELG
jgi:hypothetical protein